MHYHIRWSDSKLDWKPFCSREAAEQAASRLARRGETFTVEYADDKTCMQRICKRMVRKEMDGQLAVKLPMFDTGETRILIADENPSVRQSLRSFFDLRADVKICGEAASGEQVLQMAFAQKPDLIILDVLVPDLNGIAVRVLLKFKFPRSKTLLFTTYDETIGGLASLASVKATPEEDGYRHSAKPWMTCCKPRLRQTPEQADLTQPAILSPKRMDRSGLRQFLARKV